MGAMGKPLQRGRRRGRGVLLALGALACAASLLPLASQAVAAGRPHPQSLWQAFPLNPTHAARQAAKPRHAAQTRVTTPVTKPVSSTSRHPATAAGGGGVSFTRIGRIVLVWGSIALLALVAGGLTFGALTVASRRRRPAPSAEPAPAAPRAVGVLAKPAPAEAEDVATASEDAVVPSPARAEVAATPPTPARTAARALDVVSAIAPLSAATAAPRTSRELGGLSQNDLYRRAQELNVRGRSRMTREQLIDAVQAAESREPAALGAKGRG